MIINEYIPILYAFSFAFILTIIIYFGSYIFAYQKADTEKVSPYECGFSPFEDARHKFQVKFYLVGILFLIFDLEVVYLFPWSLTLNQPFFDQTLSYFFIMLFLFILTIGFIYEWKKGALEWE